MRRPQVHAVDALDADGGMPSAPRARWPSDRSRRATHRGRLTSRGAPCCGAPGGRRARGGERDDGSGTVLVLGVVVVALVLATTLAGLGQVVAGRGRVQTAADLAALAAATRWRSTTDVGGACDLADQVAARNGADLTGCRHEGAGVVRVTVSVPTPFGPTRSSARAGPSSAR